MPLPSPHKPDPYTNFKDDDQRRRALNWRATCHAIIAVAVSITCVCLASDPIALHAILRAVMLIR